MNSMGRVLIGLAIATLVPVAAAAQKVTYDIAHGVDLSKVETFAFRDLPASDETEDTTAYNSPFVKERTHAAIAAELQARGLRRDDTRPDVYITTRRTFKTVTTV